jgi:hypothetical protein
MSSYRAAQSGPPHECFDARSIKEQAAQIQALSGQVSAMAARSTSVPTG